MIECLECKAEFKAIKNLHLHLKVHGGMASYYQKHYPRRDKLDNQLISFQNVNQYFSSCFNSLKNRNRFFKGCSKEEGREAILEELSKDQEYYQFSFLPPQNYYITRRRVGLLTCARFFDSRQELSDLLGIENFYNTVLDQSFWDISQEELDEMEIFVDTREQLPFSFKNSMINKLDFGDYGVGGEYFDYVFVDRKSCNDFKGTFGVGIDRFEKEVQRAKKFNSFLYVVVEETIQSIIRENMLSKYPTKLSYAMSNVRKLILQYPETIQFVFCDGKSEAQSVTQKILYFGSKLNRCDLQYYLDDRRVGK